jgi:ABC-2 type transport system permease protein
MVAVFLRELRAYFQGIIGFVFMGFFLLISGLFFTVMNLLQSSPEYNSVLGSITFIFLIVVPILTMRLFTEEARQRTDQLLLTSPLSITSIVLGKYLAAQAVFLLTLVITFLYPILISTVSIGRIAVAHIIGAYIGFFLLGSTFIAVGLFVSSLTDNQMIAAVVTFSSLLFVWILDWIQQAVPSDQTSGLIFSAILGIAVALFVYLTIRNWIVTILVVLAGTALIVVLSVLDAKGYEGFIVRFLQWFSLLKRFGDFNKGVLSLSPIVYYISFCAAFIFLTVRIIEKRRWK